MKTRRKKQMSNQSHSDRWHSRGHWENEGLIRAVGFGGFLIVLGIVFAITPDLFQKISTFFNDLTTQHLPFAGGLGNVVLPAPQNPATHMDLYRAVMQFDIGIAALEFVLLFMRLSLQRVHRVAETVGNLVFWGGAAFLTNMFLLMGTLKGWFEYWAALVVLVGVSLIVRALVHFARRR
jgi:hypothetical protein